MRAFSFEIWIWKLGWTHWGQEKPKLVYTVFDVSLTYINYLFMYYAGNESTQRKNKTNDHIQDPDPRKNKLSFTRLTSIESLESPQIITNNLSEKALWLLSETYRDKMAAEKDGPLPRPSATSSVQSHNHSNKSSAASKYEVGIFTLSHPEPKSKQINKSARSSSHEVQKPQRTRPNSWITKHPENPKKMSSLQWYLNDNI